MPGIVVGIDGSEHSLRALDWAVKEAGVHQAPLTVITVYRAVAGYWGSSVTYPEDHGLSAQAARDAQEAAEKAVAAAGEPRPKSVTVQAISGIPAEELVNASKDADMLVMGCRGSGGFARLLLGSVSSQVVHHARCPVVIIPDGERDH